MTLDPAYPVETVAAPGNILFISTASALIISTDLEETLVGSGLGGVIISAADLIVGKKFIITLQGFISDTANPTFETRVKLNGNIIATTGAASLMTGVDDHWVMAVSFTVRAEGSGTTGKIVAAGSFQTEAPIHAGMGGPAELDIDTTIAQTVEVTGEWSTGSASNTIICVEMTINKTSV